MKPRIWTIPWVSLIALDGPKISEITQVQLVQKEQYDKAIKALRIVAHKRLTKKHMVALNALKDLGEE